MGHDIKRVSLPKDCDTPFAAALHEEISREMSNLGEVQLDASGVERINTPAIQFFIMLARALGTENIQMSVESCSQAFTMGFEQLGLGAQLAEWRTA